MKRKNTNEIDEKAVRGLLEISQDLHLDSIRQTKENLNDLTQFEIKPRQYESSEKEFAEKNSQILYSGFTKGVIGAAGAGIVLAKLASSQAFAVQATDVQILQTAASIEVLAVNTYNTALGLSFIGGADANSVVKTFAQTTMKQHQEHQQVFNSAISKLGGNPQNNPDPALLQVVKNAEPGLTNPAAVVALALELEQGAAETYVEAVSALKDSNSKAIMASIMGVEAQHAAILRAVQALLSANEATLIALPPNVAQLPSAAGSVGFPDAFFPTNQARPFTEGALS
jgi:rubrerythrin